MKFVTILSILMASLCLLSALPYNALANDTQTTADEEQSRKIVKVGFPVQKNQTEKHADGTYSGYTADYIAELIKYTGWEVEYVDVEDEGDINTQISILGQMLLDGEIDMLGTMNISDYLQEVYLYPSYSYGSTYTSLTVAQNSPLWQSDELQSWNGIKVAACPTLSHRMEQLEQFALVNGFSYDIIEYEDIEQVYEAVLSGKADACLQVDINIADGFRIIARFNPSPYYFALNKERTDLLKDLNFGMYNLLEAYPSLQSELYSRYFLHKDNFQLSDEDRAWVESLEPVRVLYFTGNMPIQDQHDESPSGVAANFFSSFSKATGLKTQAVFTDNYEDARRLIKEGSIDMIAAMSGTSTLNSEALIRLSLPYFESSAVLVARSDTDIEHINTQTLPASVEDKLNQLKLQPNSATLLDAYCASYYLRKSVVYDKLYVEWADRTSLLYSVGFLPSVDSRLISIINGYANSLSDQTKQGMLYSNSREPFHYSFKEFIEIYRWHMMTLLSVCVILLLLVFRARRARVMRETSVEVEHLHQFSMMLNEGILKYDIKQDRLIMQNNQIIFKGREVIQPFLSENANVECADENEQIFVERLREMLRNKLTTMEFGLNQDGALRWFRINLAYIDDNYTIGRLSDIDEEVQHRNMLEHEANHDALTGLMNRSAIHHSIRKHLDKEQEGVFLLLDLDNFKKINDTLGHREGDKVLQIFAKYMEKDFSHDYYKARLGGDEFVIFLPVCIPEETLKQQLDDFLKDIVGHAFAQYSSCSLSVSIGAAYVSECINNFDDLYREADSAMYVAKYGGKNRAYISDGDTCARKKCIRCREKCKKRQYLIEQGILPPDNN